VGPIVAVLLALAPGMPHERAAALADSLTFEAEWYRVDLPDLIALAFVESGLNPRKITGSPNGYGLFQIHTSSASPRFLGRERSLLDVRTNVREGVRIYAMWSIFHATHCHPGSHDVLGHFKWGRIVRSGRHAAKTRALAEWIRARMSGGST
jgi:hypothetical protein